MTKAEAIQTINNYYPSSSKGEYEDLRNALNIAIRSLEADVKPVVRAEWVDGRCTNCHVALNEVFFDEPISYGDIKYCPFCGAEMEIKKGDKDGI